MIVKMVTEGGEEHGCINSVGNSVREDGFKYMTPEVRAKAEKKKKEDSKIVKARYINHRGQNERMDKVYCLGGAEPIQSWHCIPGYVYEMPLGLVEEVNKSPGLPRRSEVLDASERPTTKDGPPERIHELVPISF